MLTEQDAVSAVPPSGFIHDYVTHAVKQTTSPLCYHLGVGLSILSCTCPLDYGMNYAGRLRANMFALLVGRSGEDQKTSRGNRISTRYPGASAPGSAVPGPRHQAPGRPAILGVKERSRRK